MHKMGQHKHNPTAIAAKEGKLLPKQKNKKSKREEWAVLNTCINALLYEQTGIGLTIDGGMILRGEDGFSVKVGGRY